ncbi:MAG: lactaldehyde reductase [Quinella sp. 2Q5]|nr:lactaldehyde reductase [Quinella sp. 2Q5]
MANRIILNETSYFGPGAISEIVGEIKGRGCRKVMVVTDKDLIKFKVATRVTDLLAANGIAFEIYDNIKANPTIENVQTGVDFCKRCGADIIVAVGGGSAIDTSKAIAIIMTNPEFADVRSLEGVAPTKNKALPIIAVSTTSGTAAEVTINYVITDVERNRKFVCVDPHDIPVVAVVDSEMSASMPPKLCAATGMDALVHAIEGYITKGAWELTDMVHLKAIEIISKNLRRSVKGDPAGREAMALGQYIAGMGFSNVGLGIDHSMAHPLSAVYDIPHGTACAILLAPVLKFNAPATGERYREIARAMGVKGVDEMSQDEYRAAAIEAVAKLSSDVGIPTKLSELGVKADDIDFLAASALADACTPGNPRDVTAEEIAEIYRSIL